MQIADQMISERGIDDVSMREIVQMSGQRNASVIAYHFGGRDGLLLAVYRQRLAALQEIRREKLVELDREGRGDDLRALVEISILPLSDQLRAVGGSHYARFSARMTPRVDFTSADFNEVGEVNADVLNRYRRTLRDLPDYVASLRVELAMNMMVGTLAAYEQRQEEGLAMAPLDEVVNQLIDMIVGALTAPYSQPS